MAQPKRGFGTRLGRAIDRWPGGGKRAFVRALAEYAEQNRLYVPTSYRTLINYVTKEDARPSAAWIAAAAAVLRVSPDHLLTGERLNEEERGIVVQATRESGPRFQALMHLVVNRYGDLPMGARWMMLYFVDTYLERETKGWEAQNWTLRRPQVERIVKEYFGPLLDVPTMRHEAVMALTASLAAAAYTRLGAERQGVER